jgi:hypothetical protein
MFTGVDHDLDVFGSGLVAEEDESDFTAGVCIRWPRCVCVCVCGCVRVRVRVRVCVGVGVGVDEVKAQLMVWV